jgi:broad specificity phosphatase PhoE
MSSPFLRCAETAYRISEVFDDVSIEINYGLSEYMNRNWFPSNPLRDLVIHEWNFPVNNQFRKPTYPEGYSIMRMRMADVFKRLINEYVRKGKIVVAVTHGFAPIIVAEEIFAESCPFVSYCSITTVAPDNGKMSLFKVAAIDHVKHLL